MRWCSISYQKKFCSFIVFFRQKCAYKCFDLYSSVLVNQRERRCITKRDGNCSKKLIEWLWPVSVFFLLLLRKEGYSEKMLGVKSDLLRLLLLIVNNHKKNTVKISFYCTIFGIVKYFIGAQFAIARSPLRQKNPSAAWTYNINKGGNRPEKFFPIKHWANK